MVPALGLAIAVGAAAPVRAEPAQAEGITRRVSVGPGGAQADEGSGNSALSPGGRYVVFTSFATNLVPGDTNGWNDVFVHDRRTGTTERVSVGRKGAQGDEFSDLPALSRGGRYVAFGSAASNLVPDDTNDAFDVFVRDRRAGTTERVSVGPGGAQGNQLSNDPAISPNGRFVAFISAATNLVPGDTNGQQDVFVRDRRTGRTERVSVATGGAQGNDHSFDPVLSADGRYVAFGSWATNLVPNDTNGWQDGFVHDRWTRTTRRVSVATGGAQADGFNGTPRLSADGRYVAFESFASNLVPGDTNDTSDVFVRDRRTGTTERVSVGRDGAQGDLGSSTPAISPGGRYVAFTSTATNLVPGDKGGQQDVFVRDRRRGRTERVSVGLGGAEADDFSLTGAISAGGRVVAFSSAATNLVPGDTNGWNDVFVRARRAPHPPPGW
jgi:Tol biopolymer transport system component